MLKYVPNPINFIKKILKKYAYQIEFIKFFRLLASKKRFNGTGLKKKL